ncbi:MAG TPA: FAD-dependent monooxygenase [Microlunatus sp.]
MRTVLISGAGVAGATLAHWLDRAGLSPTLVEQSQGVRSSGNPVDVRDAALGITATMGVLPALRDHATHASGAVIINAAGTAIATLPGGPNAGRDDGTGEVEVPRADLARVLLDSCRDSELIFDDSISELTDDGTGVDVRFRSGRERRFDLVIGADGVHSATRKLIFGPEQQFLTHLGLYVGTVAADLAGASADVVQLYNAPGRVAAVHPGRDVPGAAFIFRHPQVPDFDSRATALHKKLILDSYAGDGWLVPQLLDRVRATDDLYFDAVSRIDLPKWSRGRVGLVGDAASSISLLGDGSTKAIIGAHTLAEELAATDDHRAAFRRYQDRHRRLISSRRSVRIAAAMLVPKTAAGLAVRNGAARTFDRLSRSRFRTP